VDAGIGDRTGVEVGRAVMRRRLIAAGAALLVLAGLASMYGPLADVLGGLILGWVSYLARVVPKVRVAWGGVATAVLCLALLTVGLHRWLGWLIGAVRREDGSPAPSRPRWRLRWTGSIVALVVAMFAVGIAAAGIAHQAGWLVASRRNLVEERAIARHGRWSSSPEHLRQIGLATGMTFDSKVGTEGKNLQSWQTQILFLLGYEFDDGLRKDLPWDDPRNSAFFRGVIPAYLNPEIAAIRSPEGYALSHYAGNVHVLGSGRLVRSGDSSTTILAGEVAAGFRPWGDPGNLRDPGLGVNASPAGFGGPSGSGAHFVFLDGSVRFLKATTDPGVLRRLSRPDGGE
jgi:hypothetical protein